MPRRRFQSNGRRYSLPHEYPIAIHQLVSCVLQRDHRVLEGERVSQDIDVLADSKVGARIHRLGEHRSFDRRYGDSRLLQETYD